MTKPIGTVILDGLYVPVQKDIGRPITQGSMRPVRGKVRADNPDMYRWRAAVADGVRQALGSDWEPLDRPTVLGVAAEILVPFQDVTVRQAGDIDKHLRTLLDAISLAKLWRDDSQVSQAFATKVTPNDHEAPGVRLTVWVCQPLRVPTRRKFREWLWAWIATR